MTWLDSCAIKYGITAWKLCTRALVLFRVCMGPNKPGKSLNFILTFSRTGKSRKKTSGPGKSCILEKSLKFTSEKGYRSCVLQCFVTYFLLFWCGASWIEFLGSMVNFEPCCQVKENIWFICLSSAREEEKSNFPNWSWTPGVLIHIRHWMWYSILWQLYFHQQSLK